MPQLERYLSALNLNEDQIELFLTIASDGPLTILELSSKTAIPRTTVYLYIEELTENELLKEIIVGKKKKYEAASLTRLSEIIQSKKNQLEHIVQDLSKNTSELEMYYYASTKPKLHIIEGVESMRKLFQEISQEDHLEMIWSSPSRKIFSDSIEYLYDLLDKYMVQTKELIIEDHQGKLRKIQAQNTRNKIALLPTEYETESDLILAGHKVIHLLYSDIPMAFILDDKRLAHTEKMKFLALWHSYFKDEE